MMRSTTEPSGRDILPVELSLVGGGFSRISVLLSRSVNAFVVLGLWWLVELCGSRGNVILSQSLPLALTSAWSVFCRIMWCWPSSTGICAKKRFGCLSVESCMVQWGSYGRRDQGYRSMLATRAHDFPTMTRSRLQGRS